MADETTFSRSRQTVTEWSTRLFGDGEVQDVGGLFDMITEAKAAYDAALRETEWQAEATWVIEERNYCDHLVIRVTQEDKPD